MLVTVKKQRAEPTALRSHTVKTAFSHELSTTETVSSTSCTRLAPVNSFVPTKRPRGQACHRGSLELSSTHLKTSSVNLIQSSGNSKEDDRFHLIVTLARSHASVEPWHDRGVAHSTSRCASLQRTHEVGGTLCFGKELLSIGVNSNVLNHRT